MKVKVLIPFVAEIDGVGYLGRKGAVLELPAGADWLTAGWVVPVKETEQEAAVLEPPPETAVKPRAKRRKLEKKNAKSGNASND